MPIYAIITTSEEMDRWPEFETARTPQAVNEIIADTLDRYGVNEWLDGVEPDLREKLRYEDTEYHEARVEGVFNLEVRRIVQYLVHVQFWPSDLSELVGKPYSHPALLRALYKRAAPQRYGLEADPDGAMTWARDNAAGMYRWKFDADLPQPEQFDLSTEERDDLAVFTPITKTIYVAGAETPPSPSSRFVITITPV